MTASVFPPATISATSPATWTAPDWPGFRLAGLAPAVGLSNTPPAGVQLTLTCGPLHAGAIQVDGRLCATAVGVLAAVELLAGSDVAFGRDATQVRVLVLSRYGGDVVPLVPAAPAARATAGEPNEQAATPPPSTLASEDVMVIYDRAARQAVLIGFLGSERWQGRISLNVSPTGAVQRLAIGYDGGDLALVPGDDLAMEPFAIAFGAEPWALLEQYGDLVRARHGVRTPAVPPVSWCSWYAYRLGVSEERLLAEARIAAQRLRPLGLSIIEADLGWERDCLPHVFEPNERFPHGLRWLAEQLRALGFRLGVWKAPFTISALDALPREHPEWLIGDADGRPRSVWRWFWEPHGDVHILDLTHPGAQQWLRGQMATLAAAGIGYFKADFIGMAADGSAKQRHDARLVAGGGTEAARIGARIIREALPEAQILNCGGPPLPGTGGWPLLYICNDTGNTGLLAWDFMRANFRAVACHLWQNRRWGMIQPSCLCVGLPGTLEEARLRATVAFLAGGQVDISDTLTTLPEDRWQVLTATLPPLGRTARPVDLFDPVLHRQVADYEALCRGEETAYLEREHTPGSVWHLPVDGGWDQWHLVACFNLDLRPVAERMQMTNFTIPLAALGLAPDSTWWAAEFWSGQFLGVAPGHRRNHGTYTHPGDWQDLLMPGPDGTLSLSFTGPGVKLLVLRRPRPHPWIVATSFHQSGGMELRDVAWDAARGELRGELLRPPGEQGWLLVAGAAGRSCAASVAGVPVTPTTAAQGAWRVPLIARDAATPWCCRFGLG